MQPNRDFGKTDFGTVVVLPEWPIDMAETESVPMLQVTVQFRPEVSAVQMGVDLYRLWSALNQYELSLRGGGLKPVESTSGVGENSTCRLTYRPAQAEGAGERFAHIVERINDSAQVAISLPVSIARCEAACVRSAA